MPVTQNILVELNNVFLKSDRGERIFQDLSLTLKAGCSAVITGATGSGKTCMVELIIGLRSPHERFSGGDGQNDQTGKRRKPQSSSEEKLAAWVGYSA